MFGFKKKENKVKYDPETMKPIIRASICTGEQVAGFRDKRTGQFTEVCLIKTPADLQKFKEDYNLTDVEKVY